MKLISPQSPRWDPSVSRVGDCLVYNEATKPRNYLLTGIRRSSLICFHKNNITMAIMKVIEVLASSPKSWEDATKKAVARTAKSVKNIKSAFVQNHSVVVKSNKVTEFRVNVKITFEVK